MKISCNAKCERCYHEKGRRQDLDENDQYKEEPLSKGRKIGRNDPCLCGSGKKYKKCCLKKNE